MSPHLYRSVIMTGAAILAFNYGFTSCQDEEFGYDRSTIEHAAFLRSGIFDFSTSSIVNLSVDYCRPGASNPVFVYDEYPYDDEGDLKPGVEAVFAFFLDNGAFDGVLDLPNATHHLWLAAGGIGLPTLVEAEVVDGHATYYNTETRGNMYYYTYLETEVLADFSAGGWTPRETCTVGKVTWHGDSNKKALIDRTPVTFGDGRTWTTALATSSGTDNEFTTRYFSFHVDHAGTVKVYYRNPNDSKNRITYISTDKSKSGNFVVGKYNGNVTTEPVIVSGNVLAGSDVYVWCDNNVSIYAITFTYETDDPRSGVLSPADYTYRNGASSGMVTDNGKYSGMANNVTVLYDWSVTGKPKAGEMIQGESTTGNSFEEMYYTWDNAGNPSKNGIDFYLGNTKQADDYKGVKPQKVLFDKGLQNFSFKENDSKVSFTAPSAGNIYMYPDNWGSKSKDIGFDGNNRNVTAAEATNANGYAIHVEAGNHYFSRGDNSWSIYSLKFVPDGGGDSYRCIFSSNKIVNLKNDAALKDGETGIFSLTKTGGSLFETIYAVGSNGGTHGVQLNSRWDNVKGDNYNQDAPNFRFILPANTIADVTVYYQSDAASKNASVFLNGVTTTVASAPDADTEYILSRTNGGLCNIFGIKVTCRTPERTDNYYQSVKRFPRYDDEVLPTDWKLQAVTDRLTNKLWHGYTGKQEAKSGLKSDQYNKELAYQQQGDQSTTITNETGTKLYVTFMAEYNARACNSLCYFVYPKDQTPTDSKDIKLYTIFPNCSSTEYNNSRKYKVDGKYLNEDLVPLRNGDQVQLMYPNGDGTFSETFPKDVTVGWCLIYNGFDGWDATNHDFETSTIRLDKANNNVYPGYTEPYSRMYYSIHALNDDEQPRCIAFTDPVTKQVSLCWEDSYDIPGDAAANGDTKKDMTYDDIIFTVTATDNTDMTTPGVDIPNEPTPTTISYTQKGIYLFEDIWNGNQTDFDMNDVAVKYKRIFTIGSDNKVKSVNETYTLMNDGATYDDAFAIRLPYTASQVSSIQIRQKGGQLETLALNNTSIVPNADNHPRLENEDGKLNLVLFDNINLFADADMQSMTWDVVLTLAGDGISIAQEQISGSSVVEEKFTFGRRSYNPFIIVYTDVRSDGKRCEIHQPDFSLTKYGIATGSDNTNNNRWNVARTQIAGGYMPFALDLPDDNFISPHEGKLITEAFTQFADWAKSLGTKYTDWYKQTPTAGSIGWDRVYDK